MPEKKLTTSVGERMTTETLEVKSGWSNPDYEIYEESLKELIFGKFKVLKSTPFPDCLSGDERKLVVASRLGHFIHSLPVLVIGYFHKRGALSSSKDTRRMDWIIKKWGEAGFSMGYDYQAKEPWVEVSSEEIDAEKWKDLRAFIDDHMARELN